MSLLNKSRSLQNKKEKSAWFTFAICCLTAALIFLPFVLIDKGLFQYCGDFNSQQMPFYHYANDFVKNSNGQYSWESDLGGSFINTFSFYLVGSPFFWLSSLFPTTWAPYFLVPLLVLKFGVCGAGAHLYLRRYAKTDKFTVIAACLYAFSGFTVYNVFFNHFVDCIALFPFLLWSLDEFVYEKRRGLFPVFVAINLLNNYFFFVGQVVFLVLYFIFKVVTREYKIKFTEFLLLAFESLLGCAMGFILCLPTLYSLMDNPRTVNYATGWSAIMYYRVQQYFAIATSILLPPDPPYLPALYTEGSLKWTSMTAFLPLLSIAGVVAYWRAHRKSFLNKILFTSLVMAMVPALNSSFYAMNSSYYARWYYMPVLMMCLASLHALEDEEIDLLGGVKTTFILTAVLVVFGIIPVETDGVWSLGVANEPAQYWLSLCTALLALLVCMLVVKWYRRRKNFAKIMLVCVLAFSVLYSVAHISIGKFPQWEGDKNLRSQAVEATQEIAWPEGFYRIDAYECYENMGLFTRKPCIRFFNSTITPSIMNFYPEVDVKRDVSSKPDYDIYALRGLLSVEYTMMPLDKQDAFTTENQQYGWQPAWQDATYAYYKNTNYIPIGFTYDQYVSMTALDSVAKRQRSNMLVRAIGLSDEQIEKYGYLYLQGEAATADLTYNAYVTDAANRRQSAADSFIADNTGFTAHITLNKENLVFFSVPYEEGFTAYVNGVQTEIENVSYGLCAVLAPAGECEIVFVYETPGLAVSTLVTFIGIAVWVWYILLLWFLRRRKAQRPATPQYEARIMAQQPPVADTLPTPAQMNTAAQTAAEEAPMPPPQNNGENL